MTLNHLKISKAQILKIIEELGYTKIPATIFNDLGKYLVDYGKDFMQHQFDVDAVNPKTGQIVVSTIRASTMKRSWESLTYKITDDFLEIFVGKEVTSNSGLLKRVMASEYGNSGNTPYPLYRKFVYFVENNQNLIVKQYIMERGL